MTGIKLISTIQPVLLRSCQRFTCSAREGQMSADEQSLEEKNGIPQILLPRRDLDGCPIIDRDRPLTDQSLFLEDLQHPAENSLVRL